MSHQILNNEQAAKCQQYGAGYFPASDFMKVGITKNVQEKIWPINGLRHPPSGDTTGWYIWAGEELSSDANFFHPLHVEHLSSWCPEVLPYLGLPPGYRFLITPDYEDVWYDPSLLDVE